MNQAREKAATGLTLSRRYCLWCVTMALAALALLVGTGCDEDAAARAFRDAASTNLQAGVNSIMDGVVDGLFAAFELTTEEDGAAGA
jgi:hypothetical protein